MKIYFEDGVLTAKTGLEIGSDCSVNGSFGYSHNVNMLDKLMDENPNATVYTNSLVALVDAQRYCWDEDNRAFELYIRSRKTSEFKRIDSLTDRELRMPHNILHLYLSGAFYD